MVELLTNFVFGSNPDATLAILPILLGLGGGALLGGAKSALIDAPRAERQRKLAAETQRYSPWTGMQAQPIQEADALGSMMQGGLSGASLGQGIEQMQYLKGLQTPANPWEGMTGIGPVASGTAYGSALRGRY